MASLGLVNIGALATGILASPRLDADAILVEHGRIAALGAGSRTGAEGADVVVDCRGTTVIPGLIDSHCHVVLGDYTPRQKTVDFLDSYVHGGITSVVSAGEGVHAPGRPHDSVAAKALAIAAAKRFANFPPNGMTVIAASVALEPGLTDTEFARTGRLAPLSWASAAPPGTAVMPLGVVKSVCEPAWRGALPPAEALALATGNNARIFRLARGTGAIAVGAPADLVVCDAPAASLAKDALDAIARGDIPGISCVVIDGRVSVGRSRNTPLAKRLATFTGVSIDGGGHA